MKVCKICKVEKPSTEYYKHKLTRDKLQTYCKECTKEIGAKRYVRDKDKIDAANRKWRLENPEKYSDAKRRWLAENRGHATTVAAEWRKRNVEKARASTDRWRSNNPERAKELARKYAAENKDQRREATRAWRRKNVAHLLDYDRKYKEKNRAQRAANERARDAMKARSIPTWADLGAIKRIYEDCPVGMTVDHIVPLRSEFVCGLHWEGNLQYLTNEENASKGNRWWPDMP